MIRNQTAYLQAQSDRAFKRERAQRAAVADKPISVWTAEYRHQMDMGVYDDLAWARAQMAQALADHEEAFDVHFKEMI